MCRPIRSLTEGKGYDARHHRLAAFGGAGGQHACSVARILHINEVVIHKYSSILSAYGMALADVVHESLEPSSEILCGDSLPRLQARLDSLQQKSRTQLIDQGFSDQYLRYERYLNLRYQGTSTSLMIPEPQDGDFEAAFSDRHLQEFSFHVPGRPVVVDDIRVRGIAFDPLTTQINGISEELAQADKSRAPVDPSLACDMTSVFFEDTGRLPTAVYMLESLPRDHYISVSEHSLGE